ncbi:MAG TPA: hypothetical protein P5056_02735 [Candidatus Paceibacterota bacterium]|nr:hypothetical protein [Candidatus Paceibacterota bacterium]
MPMVSILTGNIPGKESDRPYANVRPPKVEKPKSPNPPETPPGYPKVD